MINYKVTRYDEIGDQLFICINAIDTPVYVEHYFNEEERLDIAGTIEKLLAELEIRQDEYLPPPIVTDKKKDLKTITPKEKKIQEHKIKLINDKIKQDEGSNININSAGS